MTSIIDAFDYRTIEVRVTEKDIVKISAHCLGDLGAFRFDQAMTGFGGIDLLKKELGATELWTVTTLNTGLVFFQFPTFKNLDNALAFVHTIHQLYPKWATASSDVAYQFRKEILVALTDNNGIPLAPLLFKILRDSGEDPYKDTRMPGNTGRPLNGYPEQPPFRPVTTPYRRT